MTKPITKWGGPEVTPTARFFHERIRKLAAERTRSLGGEWKSLVFARGAELLSAADLETIERELLATGHRFEYSATISIRESPEKYRRRAGAAASEAAAEDEQGRIEVGAGDNLVKRASNLRGIARFVSTLDQVTEMLVEGVPAETIAVIDDSGGTLTAPILESFAGVLCLGGTVRSHLGILTREYGIPCLMNCKIGPALSDGDRVEVEFTAPAVSAEDYESGKAVRAKIWKLREPTS